MMGFLSPTFANAPMDLGGKKPGPPGPLYIVGEGGQQYPSPWRLPLPPVTPLSPACAWRSPAGIPATSTTTPSCCWISINLFFPLLDQGMGDVTGLYVC